MRKHFEGDGPGRRADHRAADPRRRDRPGRQHPARLDQRRLGPRSTATRSAPPRSWPTSRASPPSRGSAPPCRASRRCERGDIGVRSLQDWAAPLTCVPTALFDQRPDPDRPRAGAPHGVPGDPGGAAGHRRCAGRTPGDAGAGAGPDLPERARAGRRLRQERRRHRRARRRSASATSRSARSPGEPQPGNPTAAAVPAARRPRGRQPDGLQQRRRRGGRRPAARPARPPRTAPVARASTSARPRSCPRTRRVARLREVAPRLLAPYADYLVVNVSSPNTPGLRNLQAVEKLRAAARAPCATAADDGRPTAACRCW